MSDEKFFESRWIVAKKYLIYFFFAILSMVIMAIGDDSGLGLIFIPIFLVIASIMTFYFIFMSVNKTTPLIEVDVEGISVRPSRHNDTIRLLWNDVKKVNYVKCNNGKIENHFLVIHPTNPQDVISNASAKIKRRLKKMKKVSSTPLCLQLRGLNGDERLAIVEAISDRFEIAIDVFSDHKQLEYYREIVRANNDEPPNIFSYDVAAQLAKRPKEIVRAVIIGISIVPAIFLLIPVWDYFSEKYRTAYNSKESSMARAPKEMNAIWVKALKLGYVGTINDFDIAENGDIFFSGSFEDESRKQEGLYGRLDKDGNLIWQNSITGSGDENINGIRVLESGNIILVGETTTESKNSQDGGIILVNPMGEQIWEKTISPNGTSFLNAVEVLPNNNIVIVGSSNVDSEHNTRIIVVLNEDGDVVWQKTAKTEYPTGLSSVIVSKNGNILVGGYLIDPERGRDVWLAKYTPEGKFLKQDNFGTSGYDWGYDIHENKEGKIIIGGLAEAEDPENGHDMLLFTLEPNELEILNSNSLAGNKKGTNSIHTITETTDGKIVAGGQVRIDGGHAPIFVEFDEDLESSNEFRLKPRMHSVIKRMHSYQDGSYLVSGSISINNQSRAMVILRTVPNPSSPF